MDFVGPEVEDDELRTSSHRMIKRSVRQWVESAKSLHHVLRSGRVRRCNGDGPTRVDAENLQIEKEKKEIPNNSNEKSTHDSKMQLRHTSGPLKHVMLSVEESTVVPTEDNSQGDTPIHTNAVPSRVGSPESAALQPYSQRSPPPRSDLPEFFDAPESQTATPSRESQGSLKRYTRRVLAFVKSLCNPPCLSILVAVPISLITPLKALFTPVPNSPIPNAPDGQPPLAFILDTTTFIGNGSVPLGLICLGSALARLKIPRHDWKSLPVGAIAWLALSKMIVMPVLGVLITNGFVSVGLIPAENKVLRFVSAYVSIGAFC